MLKHAIAGLILLAAGSAQAADPKDFDLGYIRLGMMQGQYRFGAWPVGQTIWCSDDPTKPKDLEKQVSLPKSMASLGASRCGLFQTDAKDNWSLATRNIAGQPTKMTAIFALDEQGLSRVVQVFLEQPRAGFDGLVAHFTARFGPPAEKTERLVRWAGARGEATVIHEDGDTAMAMLIDNRMQQIMNQKMAKKP